MPRIPAVDPAAAQGKAKALLDTVHSALGVVPNMTRTMVQSPSVLESYLAFSKAMSGASLSGKVREQIALAVAGANACGYCASAHTLLGGKLGVSEDEAARNLEAASSDPKLDAALKFSRAVVAQRGFLSDEQFQAVRDAGYSDAQITEIIATIALNTFTNYFNHIAQPEIDFPAVEVGEPAVG